MSNPPHPENGTDAPGGPVPAENQPGHHPAKEQDRPDLDAFAERLGVVEAREQDHAEDQSTAPTERSGRSAPAIVGVVAALFVVLAVLAGRRRRRSR
jgi:cobalamin biosynthesis Mg chelatase CobN